MDQVAITVSSFVHRVEELRLPVIPVGTFVKLAAAAVPIAVLAHETASLWLPKQAYIPIISWFQRKWRSDPQAKDTHLRSFRNFAIFVFFIVLQMKTMAAPDVAEPSDYVEQRLTSANALRNMDREISAARQTAYNVANEVLGEEEMNLASAEQLRDSVLRRRHLHEQRQAH